ncbi:MAG: hypothetical protein J6X89_07345 [Bacteroidales bacterium]|nr:hypothetical protein [Bacteroidales bacterium]
MSEAKKRLFCFSAAAALLILITSSCITVNQTLGSVYAPSDRDLKVHTVSFDLPVGMKMANQLQTSTSYFVLGNLVDETFGATNAEFAATVNPPDTLPWGKNPVYKSAKIQFLKFSIQTLGDCQEEIPQNIHVYALKAPMDTTKIYSNSYGPDDYTLEEIAEGAVMYCGGDTLTIPLKDSFARKYMDATQQELDSTDLFIKRFYGIYVKSDRPLASTSGGRLTKFSAGVLRFTFNSTNDLGKQRDTTVLFPIGSSYATETYTHESAAFEVDGNNNLQKIYYEGLAGIKPHISGEAIRDSLVDWAAKTGVNLKDVIVARATIELPYDVTNGDYTEADSYPAALYPVTRYKYIYDDYQYYPLSAIYDSSYDRGDINRSLQCYKPDVTLYVQNVMNMISADKPLNDSWDLWLFNYYTGEESEDDDSSSYSYNDYYNNYLYNMYYGGYGGYGYGGYGYGYGGYGYGGYSGYGGYDYYDYYNMMNYYNYYNSLSSSSSSEATVYYVDYVNYCKGAINGNGAARHPKMHITYTVRQ